MTQVTIDIEVPEGFELTGEYRKPKKDEFYLARNGTRDFAGMDYLTEHYLILRKKCPPRYTVSLDPRTRGILDAETPGEFAPFPSATEASLQSNCDGLNDGTNSRSFWAWSPIPAPPARFTISTTPCGVLDSETGLIIGPGTLIDPQETCDRLNSGRSNRESFIWMFPPPPAPVLVPLGPEDVTPGVTLIRNPKWDMCLESLLLATGRGYIAVLSAAPSSLIDCIRAASIERISFQRLMDDEYELSNDHGVTWSPCSKPSASSSVEGR